MVDDDILLIEREMVAEPLEHEDDGNYIYIKCSYQYLFLSADIQVLHTERTAIETVEGPA